MSQQADFILTVIAGPNAGASAAVGTGRFVVGGGRSDDIVLDGVADSAITVTFGGNRVRIAPGTTGISVGESLSTGATIKEGTTHMVTLPTVMRVSNDTIISLARRRPEAKSNFRLPVAAALATLALIGGTTLGMQLGESAPAVASRAEAAESAAPTEAQMAEAGSETPAILPTRVTLPEAQTANLPPAPPPAPPPASGLVPGAAAVAGLTATSPRMGPCNGTCLTEAAAGLRAGLDEAGLGSLDVQPADGVLKVSGGLPPDQAPAWERVRTRFEAQFGQSLPLIVSLNDTVGGPALAVASVWLGAQPEVRTKTGQVLRIGDLTSDGWTVETIAQGKIGLQRDSRSVTVNF